MKIEEITIQNFRTFDGQTIKLNQAMTFVVGENNLGKTNLLDLLHIVFTRSAVPEEEFRDPNKPILVVFRMRLTEAEIGLLGDICDSSDPLSVTVKATVESPDSEIEFRHLESDEPIAGRLIRRFNVFRYSSTDTDASNLSFGKERGVGKVLTRGLTLYQQRKGKTTKDFLVSDELSGLMSYLNCTFGNLPILGDYGMHVAVDETDTDALGSVITLADANDLHFRRVGSGVQYVALLMLTIVEEMIRMGERRLSQCIVEDESGAKAFSCVISLDEPEAHLHPYMQRRLVKKLAAMSEGKEVAFNAILKDFFDIDCFSAQIVIATHSPNILRKSHTELVRFFASETGGLEVVNGADVALRFSPRKHFLDRFEFVREAFFVKRVLLVEGTSEAMALPLLADTMGIDVDDCGLLVLQVGGKESLVPAKELLDAFKIKCMIIEDRDEGQASSTGDVRTTDRRDFEDEIVEELFANGMQDILCEVMKRYGQDPEHLIVPKGQLNKYATKIGFSEFDNDIAVSTLLVNGRLLCTDDSKAAMYAWLSKNKCGILWALLSASIPLYCIPTCYQAVLQSAAGIAI